MTRTTTTTTATAGEQVPPALHLYHELLADRESLLRAHRRLLAEQNALLEQIDLLCARSTAAGSHTPCASPPPCLPSSGRCWCSWPAGPRTGRSPAG